MDVDIQLYLKRIKDFFDGDLEARRDMFGQQEIDMNEFYVMVTKKATINSKKNGDPMLSGDEMLEIVADLALRGITEGQQEIDKVFVRIKGGFPPFCLN